jgi:hypothetical protein
VRVITKKLGVEMRRVFFSFLIFLILIVIPQTIVLAQVPEIDSTSPGQNELNVAVSTNISVTFDVDMDEITINDSTFIVNARSTGLHLGTISYNSGTKTATLDPDGDFDVGEVVTVVLTAGIESSAGVPLGSGYVWSFTVTADTGWGNFSYHSDYPAYITTWWAFVADLDGNGDIDLTTVSCGIDNETVCVLLNDGDGAFVLDSYYYVTANPWSVFSADLDGDGDMDLATSAGPGPHIASVRLNNGDGTFGSESKYPISGLLPWSIFAADLDGDGDIDLATTSSDAASVSILLNNGDGTFAPRSDYPLSAPSLSVFAADLDGDGDADLATTSSVLFNNGDGSFTLYSPYPDGVSPVSVFAADLDDDGDLDIATADSQSCVSVLLNNGDGTTILDSTYPVYGSPTSILAADLDDDGDLDLATANNDSSCVSVLLNNGDGTFAPQSIHQVGTGPRSISAADLNNDGAIDLATANEANSVSILLNATMGRCTEVISQSEVGIGSGLEVVYTGTGGTLRDVVVTSNPPGCDAPAIQVIGGNAIRLTWPEACVDQGEVVEYQFTVDYPCETVQPPSSVEWTYPIPTLTQWGLIILVVLIVFSTWVILRRRRAVGSSR